MRMKSRSDADNDTDALIPLYRFWQPRYWGLWLALATLRAITMLPFGLQMRCGGFFGRLGMQLVPKRRHIARVNLRLCFPELDDDAIDRLVREHFESVGRSMIDLVLACWASARRIDKLVDISDIEILLASIEQQKPIILVSGHFIGIEIVGIAAKPSLPDMAAMYRPVNNALADQIVRRARQRSIKYLIPKDSPRDMIRQIRRRRPFWYASDQAYDRKGSALVPFFGEPAMTNCALTQIAQLSKADVIFFLTRRKADLSGYEGRFVPSPENFPSDDAEADALRVHHILEDWIRETPAQYYWLHRRFKNRPAPYPDPYADSDA